AEPPRGFQLTCHQCLRIGQRGSQWSLHEVPHRVLDGLHVEFVGEDPVRAGGDLLDQVAHSGGSEPGGGCGHHAVVGHHGGRRGGVGGALEAVDADGGAVGGVAVHRGGGAHHHVLPLELTGGQFGQVVQRAGADHHGRALVLLQEIAHPFHV